MVNLISGGLHAGRNLDMQDFLLLPIGAFVAFLWANTAPEDYFRFAQLLAFPVNAIAMVFFFGLLFGSLRLLQMELSRSTRAIHQRRLKLQASLATVQHAMRNGENLQQHLSTLEESVGQQMMLSALALSPQDLALMRDQEQKLLDAQAELRRELPFTVETAAAAGWAAARRHRPAMPIGLVLTGGNVVPAD